MRAFGYLPLLVWLSISQPANAQNGTNTTSIETLGGFTGYVRLYERYREKTNSDKNTVQGQLRLDGFLNISQSGCLKLKTRLSSGDAFNTEWASVAPSVDLHLNIRHLYVDYACYKKNIQFQAGAMPVGSKGSLGLSNYGWVDGVRVIVKNETKRREVTLTLGQADDFNQANFFRRPVGVPNLTRAEVTQGFHKSSELTISVGHFEGTTYSRYILETAIGEYVKFLETLSFEEMLADTSHLGLIARATAKKENWSFASAVSHLDSGSADSHNTDMTIKSFYGYGVNVQAEAVRSLPKAFSFLVRFRDGQAGKWAEIGITKNLRFNKRR